MKNIIILFFSINLCIPQQLYAAYSNDDRRSIIAEYSINNQPLKILSYTIVNQSNDDSLCIWLDQDNNNVTKQGVYHFFMGKHFEDASLYEIAMDNNAYFTTKNVLQFFCKYLAPKESFSFYIAIPPYINGNDIIDFLNKHLLSANQQFITQWLPEFTETKAHKIMYKYCFIYISKPSDLWLVTNEP